MPGPAHLRDVINVEWPRREARTVWCMIEQTTGRPKRVTPDIVARFI